MNETLREYLDRLHWSHTSFDSLAHWSWLDKQRIIELEKRCDELVEALCKLRCTANHAQSDDPGGDIFSWMIEVVDSAISKARGEEAR